MEKTVSTTNTGIDDTDRELIALLRENARTPVAALAQRLRVSRGTVQNRMARLEKHGVITGYGVRVRPGTEPQRIRAWTLIEVEGTHTPSVIQALRGEPAVGALHSTNGRWDIVAELSTDSLESFDRVLGRLRLIEGIKRTETSILLSTHKV
jgi:DNA-binding Lrp family transcriptional regulator